MIQPALLRRLDLKSAVTAELNARTRLLPQMNVDLELARHADQVEEHLRATIQKSPEGVRASVLFAAKQRGGRPLNLWRLQDRVLYRALADHLRAQLPDRVSNRLEHEEFERAPLADPENMYITATDVASYYVYVDHGVLGDELTAQTGEFDPVMAILQLLGQVMDGKVGLPQVHDSSDLLGDTYIDPVRRRIIRAGFSAYTFSDDFRIGSSSLGGARESLEICAVAARNIGLVLNDGKTYTYRRDSYVSNIERFSVVARKVVEDNDLSAVAEFLFRNPYADDEVETDGKESPIEQETELPVNTSVQTGPDLQQVRTIWSLWTENVNDEQKSPTIRQLLDQALPILGTLGDGRPLDSLDELLRSAPELTPKIALYLQEVSDSLPDLRPVITDRLIGALTSEICSRWQKAWLLHAAGAIGSAAPTLIATLVEVIERRDSLLSAFAAEALGRLGVGPAKRVAEAVDFVAPELRGSVVWGLGQLDSSLGNEVADTEIDRLLILGTH